MNESYIGSVPLDTVSVNKLTDSKVKVLLARNFQALSPSDAAG